MTSWRIEEASLISVLEQTGQTLESLQSVVTEDTIATINEGLSWGDFLASPVAGALSTVLQEQIANIRDVGNRISAGVLGLGNAMRALQQGQQDMASNFSVEMVSAAESGDFTYFTEHGYQG